MLTLTWNVGQRSIYTTTTLKIPLSLTTRPGPRALPAEPLPLAPGADQQSDTGSGMGTAAVESYREIKCCFSVTIRRDAWGVPVAIMGQWIVSPGPCRLVEGRADGYCDIANMSLARMTKRTQAGSRIMRVMG